MKYLNYILIVLLLFNTFMYSQEFYSFGNTKLSASLASAPLRVRAVPSFSFKMASRVGGVYFEQTLTSEMSISVNYVPDNPDGYRLEVIADGIRYNPYIADWQLIPIAEFSDTDHVAVVSILGAESSEDSVNIEYHDAFNNTLLGLRLLQADIMLLNIEEFYQLPMYEGRYMILGEGEHNDYTVNQEDLEEISLLMMSMQFYNEYTSWILNDKKQSVIVNTDSQNLLSGNKPYYHFWKAAISDETKYSKNLKLLMESYEKREVSDLAKFKITTNEFIGDTIMIGNNIYRNNIYSQEILYKIQNDFIKEYNELTEDYTIAEECKEINELINSTVYQLLEKINPMVYMATDNTMKFSAFFRYIKGNNPYVWNQFMNKIYTVEVFPKINTPTELPKPKY